MKKFKLQVISIFLSVVALSCAAGFRGVNKMEKAMLPVSPVGIGFNERIVSIFPVSLEHSFGMIAGKPDHETLRIATITANHLKEKTFPQSVYEPANEIGFCLDDRCDEMFMSAKRIFSVVDWTNKKQTIKYYGIGNVLKNRYLKTKLLNRDSKLILTVFCPLYNNDQSGILNGTFSLTLEDLGSQIRKKAIPISTESGDFKLVDKSFFGIIPLVSFGPDYVIYRESYEYRWLAVNNDLEYIEHPLKDTLNEYREYFGTDLACMEISPDQPFAIAIGQRRLDKSHFVAIIQWNKAPAIMPVGMSLQKDEDIEYASLLLSPSGKWAYFNTHGGTDGSRHFLLYIDTDLPGGCLPPFDLHVTGFDNKATWITKPEGFIMQVGDKMLYWDLSKFDARSL